MPNQEEKPKLPKHIEDLDKEMKKIEEKKNMAQELNAPSALLNALNEQLAALKGAIAQALIEDAKREVQSAANEAKAIAEGRPPIAAQPGPDQQAIAGAEEELERIRQKLAKATENGATPAQLQPLENALRNMRRLIRNAALAAARRELRQARQRLDDIRNGRTPTPPPAGDSPGQTPNPPQPGGGTGGDGGAGQGGGGSTGGGAGGGMVIGAGGTRTEPEPLRLYVQSENTVWVWSRRNQAWIPMSFGSKLVEVKIIQKGIFAIAEHGAAIYDVIFDRWLTSLDSGGETLTRGDAA